MIIVTSSECFIELSRVVDALAAISSRIATRGYIVHQWRTVSQDWWRDHLSDGIRTLNLMIESLHPHLEIPKGVSTC